MKARQQIDVKSLHGEDSSYFSILAGEDIEEVLEQHKYTAEEKAFVITTVLKGNPHWVDLNTKEEKKAFEKVVVDKEIEQLRKEELKKLTKVKQIELLKQLGAVEIPHFEVDRVDLIWRLEPK